MGGSFKGPPFGKGNKSMDFATFDKIANNVNSEDGVIARFYDRVVKTDKLTNDGLPKFKLVCFCEIRIKDNNSEIYDQPATREKIRRFPREYELYKISKQQVKEGTPLEQFAFLDAAEIETLKLRGIFTVEELSSLSEKRAEELSLLKERDLANKFVQRAKGNLSLAEWQEKEEKYIQRICQLEAKLEDLQQQLKMGRKNEKYSRNMSRCR